MDLVMTDLMLWNTSNTTGFLLNIGSYDPNKRVVNAFECQLQTVPEQDLFWKFCSDEWAEITLNCADLPLLAEEAVHKYVARFIN